MKRKVTELKVGGGRRRAHRRGFTLIELVLVLVILAATAALVIPNLGFIQEQAGHSATAATSAQLVSNLETYKTSADTYPNGLESLVDENGALYGALWTHVSPTFGPSQYFEVLNMGDETAVGPGSWTTSFAHVFNASDVTGTVYVYDHDSTATDPNDSANTLRAVDFADDATLNFAFVKKTAPGGPPFPGPDVFLSAFHKTLGYPNGIPDDTQLLVMGIGPQSGLRETMASTPRHTEQGPETYGRYFAVFALHASGKSARLKAVVDSQGVGVDGNLNSYLELAPEVQ